ncbi:MAG TPA: hypothetical protein VGK19_19510 [Capsulimonadaceae bacterium]
MKAAFKTCSLCGHGWPTRDRFLADPSLVVVGYQADIDTLEQGLLMFNHRGSSCGTTLAIPVWEFLDLYRGPRYPAKRANTAGCPRYCLDKTQLKRCDVQCECAIAREALAIVTERLDQSRRNAAAGSLSLG